MIYVNNDVLPTNPVILYENILENYTELSGSEETGFEFENSISRATYDYWRPVDSGVRNAEFTLDDDYSSDCLFIDAHDLGTNGAEFNLQVSSDGGETWETATGWISPDDDSAIMVLFNTVSGNLYRLRQRNGPASIGVLMVGERLSVPGGVDQSVVTFKHGNKVEIMGGNSLGGQIIPQKVRRKGGSTSIKLPWVGSDWVNNVLPMFEDHYNSGQTFAMALNPSFDQDELAYCQRGPSLGELSPVSQAGGVSYSITMGVDYYVS